MASGSVSQNLIFEETSAIIADGYRVDVPTKSGYKVIMATTNGNQFVTGTTYINHNSLRLQLAGGTVGDNMPLTVIYAKL